VRQSLSYTKNDVVQSHKTELVAFYKQKHTRKTGSEENYVESIRISTTEGQLCDVLYHR